MRPARTSATSLSAAASTRACACAGSTSCGSGSTARAGAFPCCKAEAGIGRRQARVAELVELVGAQAYAHRAIGELSGGEQQRLLIAQALAHRPALLLLDEPLDSLDLTTQASVAALISDICHREGVTVMIVAHDVNPILANLDRVIYVAQGSAVQGSPKDVIKSETLSRLYGTNIEVLTTSSGALVVVGQPDTGVAYHHHADGAHP